MEDLFLRCECGTEGINLSHDESDVYFAMWYYGDYHMTFTQKLRWIWQILVGKPYKDGIIIEKSRIPELITWLSKLEP